MQCKADLACGFSRRKSHYIFHAIHLNEGHTGSLSTAPTERRARTRWIVCVCVCVQNNMTADGLGLAHIGPVSSCAGSAGPRPKHLVAVLSLPRSPVYLAARHLALSPFHFHSTTAPHLPTPSLCTLLSGSDEEVQAQFRGRLGVPLRVPSKAPFPPRHKVSCILKHYIVSTAAPSRSRRSGRVHACCVPVVRTHHSLASVSRPGCVNNVTQQSRMIVCHSCKPTRTRRHFPPPGSVVVWFKKKKNCVKILRYSFLSAVLWQSNTCQFSEAVNVALNRWNFRPIIWKSAAEAFYLVRVSACVRVCTGTSASQHICLMKCVDLHMYAHYVCFSGCTLKYRQHCLVSLYFSKDIRVKKC